MGFRKPGALKGIKVLHSRADCCRDAGRNCGSQRLEFLSLKKGTSQIYYTTRCALKHL